MDLFLCLTSDEKEVDSQCIFSGRFDSFNNFSNNRLFISIGFSRGEVLTIEPLLVTAPPNKEVVNFTNICLLSMATVTKVIALSVRPTIVVHFTQVLKVGSNLNV